MTQEVIVFGDIEAALVTDITYKLAGYGSSASGSTTVPRARPAEFFVVHRTGGPRKNLVTDSAQVTIDSWAETGSKALALAQLIRGIVGALGGQTISGLLIHRVQEFAGPGWLPDPESAQARYTFTASLDVRGSAR